MEIALYFFGQLGSTAKSANTKPINSIFLSTTFTSLIRPCPMILFSSNATISNSLLYLGSKRSLSTSSDALL